MTTISAYKITWVEIRPTSGITTKKDMHTLGLLHRDTNGCAYKHFGTAKHANDYIARMKNAKLDKQYECRLFSDKQYAMRKESEGYAVPFTKRQLERVTIIG